METSYSRQADIQKAKLVGELASGKCKMASKTEHVALDDQDWANRRPQIFTAEVRKVYGAYIGVTVLPFMFVTASWIGSTHHRDSAPL